MKTAFPAARGCAVFVACMFWLGLCLGSAIAETCIASQYGIGDGYHGRRAANGSIFNTHATNPYTVATRRIALVLS